jgi:hypothetical protein
MRQHAESNLEMLPIFDLLISICACSFTALYESNSAFQDLFREKSCFRRNHLLGGEAISVVEFHRLEKAKRDNLELDLLAWVTEVLE